MDRRDQTHRSLGNDSLTRKTSSCDCAYKLNYTILELYLHAFTDIWYAINIIFKYCYALKF